MRGNSATVVRSRSPLECDARRRHPAGTAFSSGPMKRCTACGGRGWVRALVELPLEIACPACTAVTR